MAQQAHDETMPWLEPRRTVAHRNFLRALTHATGRITGTEDDRMSPKFGWLTVKPSAQTGGNP
jgi:hypothetical protein